jgi:antitoxin (DNA-binding transcriptional repressor) of toxin-antitoxin stability system
MAVIHISKEEAFRDIAGVFAKVEAGGHVYVEDHGRTIAKVLPSADPKSGSLREILRSLSEEELKSTLDDKFGDDMEVLYAGQRNQSFRDPWKE